ncbi:MAG: TerC family protein [Candidatus Kapaibacterium sp.]
MHHDIGWWIGFHILVIGLLALDLGVFHRKAHEVKTKEAAIWSVVWITLSLSFNLFIYLEWGGKAGTEFLTGYLIEKSLSVDNLFIFVLIFGYFKVPSRYQHRILFWGILGALVMRASLIGIGAFLLERFHWIMYVFGAFLVFTGIRMGLDKGHDLEVEHNPLIRLLRKRFPVTETYHDQKFFVKQFGKTFITPMLVVLVLIESTDLLFALDSIPAIFAITDDTYIVYTSNIFAILGLRSLYFLLANVITKFYYLRFGLALILVYIGVKMLLTFFQIEIPTAISLAVVGVVLALSSLISVLYPRDPEKLPESLSSSLGQPETISSIDGTGDIVEAPHSMPTTLVQEDEGEAQREQHPG